MLHAELENYITEGPFGPMLKHPLMIELFLSEELHENINIRYEYKKEYLTKSLESGNFGQYLTLHERPFRAQALYEVAFDIVDDAKYWSTIRDIWMDSENIFENTGIWSELLGASRSKRELLMTEEDRDKFSELPDDFPVYRGVKSEFRDGPAFSWTTEESTALWFAERFGDENSEVLEREVSKDEVVAYFTGRGEFEVLLLP